jgi:hypothetical protein
MNVWIVLQELIISTACVINLWPKLPMNTTYLYFRKVAYYTLWQNLLLITQFLRTL